MKIKWNAEKRKISQLIPAEYNPRELTKKQANDLAVSLRKFSLADPIVINYNNRIIGGHQRINILKKQGKDIEVDVRVPDRVLDEKEEKELNLRLNKNLGQWDLDALANFDEEMLKDTGFSKGELDKMFDIQESEEGEVEFTKEILEENNYLVFVFDNVMDWQVAQDKYGVKKVNALDAKQGYARSGVGRVLDGKKIL